MVTAKAELFAFFDATGKAKWRDEGMCCFVDHDFSAFAPSIPDGTELKWVQLGNRGQRNHDDKVNNPIYMFAAMNPAADPAPFAKPEGFTFIWDDRASTSWADGSVWRLNCPGGSINTYHL